MSSASYEKKAPEIEEPFFLPSKEGKTSISGTVSRVPTPPLSSKAFSHSRHELMSHLYQALADRFGITPNQQMDSKLQRIFVDMDSVNLYQRVNELSSLPAGHASWLDLVAKITVHETYFFRDEPQLSLLRNKLLPHLIEKAALDTSPTLRILSAGCSTGEEVYSLTMLVLDALLEAGYAFGHAKAGIKVMPGWKLQILGVDVSADALNIAQKAKYTAEGLGSFRKMSSHWQHWFDDGGTNNFSVIDSGLYINTESQTYRRPKDFIRKITDFSQHNLLQSSAHLGYFDMVICRNTMIYFNDANKSIAQNYLFDRLKPEGVLLLGATDPLLCPERCVQHRSLGIAYFMGKQTS
mgnify:CR=1 FL=1